LKRLVFAEPASRDIEGIADYIALDNPAAAKRVYRAIVTAARTLREFPALGRPGRHPETRELIVPDLPYLLVYAVSADAITILAVFHTSRNLAKVLRDRLQKF
jgi:toxin ParE1/3/4